MRCTKCNIWKEDAEFSKEPRNKSGLSSHCRLCKNTDAKARSKKPESRIRANKRAAVYRKNNPESFRLGVKMASYKKQGIKITRELYQHTYALQNGYCAICGNHKSSQKKDLSLDHCHTTKKVRGFLCDNCNTALGKFKEDVQIMLKAIEYIIKHR